MRKVKYGPEQILRALRQAASGAPALEIARSRGEYELHVRAAPTSDVEAWTVQNVAP
ncbi:MAG: hypothetical protein ABIR59_06405 [Gemmatimonadales bacterium]